MDLSGRQVKPQLQPRFHPGTNPSSKRHLARAGGPVVSEVQHVPSARYGWIGVVLPGLVRGDLRLPGFPASTERGVETAE